MEHITHQKIFSFYQLPEINKVLRSKGIHLELPKQKKSNGSRKKMLLIASIPFIFLVVATSILLSNKEKDRAVANLVENSRIAVIPFTNQTGDSLMDQVGDIASSWISSQIDELKDVQTVPYFTIKTYQPYMGILANDPQNSPTFRELVDAQYFVTGSYFLKGHQLYIDAYLVDAYSQESIYHLPVMEGPKDSVMQIIEALRLKIAGLVTNLEEVKLGKLNPPNYDAYKYYLSGIKEMNVGLLHPSDALLYFEKATEMEPNFVMPQIFITWFYYGKKRDSVYQRIAEIPKITEYERSVYKESYHLFNRNYREALRISLQCLEDYPQDYYFNMVAGHRASSQYMPKLAIKVLSQLHDPLNSDVGLVWHHYKIRNYFESLVMLGKYEEALAYLQSIPVAYYSPVILELLINAYVKADKSKEEVETLIENFDLEEEKLLPVYYTSAAYEFGLTSQKETSLYFARKASEIFQSIPEVMPPRIFDLADALYLSDDLTGTKTYLEKQLEENPDNEDLLIYIALLKNALAQGQLRHHYDFERDIFLKPLFDYPPFQALVTPKDYAGITGVP